MNAKNADDKGAAGPQSDSSTSLGAFATIPVVILTFGFWLVVAMGVAWLFGSERAARFWSDYWLWVIVIAAVLGLSIAILQYLEKTFTTIDAATRSTILAFGAIPFLIVALGTAVILPSRNQRFVYEIVFIVVVCIIPAATYYLFLKSRRPSILNEFVGNLSRLGLLGGRTVYDPILGSTEVQPRAESQHERRARIDGYFQRFESLYGQLRFGHGEDDPESDDNGASESNDKAARATPPSATSTGGGALARRKPTREKFVADLIRAVDTVREPSQKGPQKGTGSGGLDMPLDEVRIADIFQANLVIPLGLVTVLSVIGWLLVLQPQWEPGPAGVATEAADTAGVQAVADVPATGPGSEDQAETEASADEPAPEGATMAPAEPVAEPVAEAVDEPVDEPAPEDVATVVPENPDDEDDIAAAETPAAEDVATVVPEDPDDEDDIAPDETPAPEDVAAVVPENPDDEDDVAPDETPATEDVVTVVPEDPDEDDIAPDETPAVALGSTADAAGAVGDVQAASASDGAQDLLASLVPKLTPVNFAFLGAYFFGIQMLFRRFVGRDLGPNAYLAFAVRIILASIAVWVLIVVLDALPLLGEGWSGYLVSEEGKLNYLLVSAFVVGVFPRILWQFISALFKKAGALNIVIPEVNQDQELTQLDGLTIWHEARLQEEDVENVPNMASVDVVDIMLRTQIPAERLICWIDQAILCTMLGKKPEGEDHTQAKAEVLRRKGVRTASQLFANYEAGGKRRQIVTKVLGEDIQAVVRAIEIEPNFELVRAWRGI